MTVGLSVKASRHPGGQPRITSAATATLPTRLAGVGSRGAAPEGPRPTALATGPLSGLSVAAWLSLLSWPLTSTTAFRIDVLGGVSRFFSVLSGVVIATAGFGIVAFLGAVCALNYRTSFLPQWITYLGWLAAARVLGARRGPPRDDDALYSLAFN